MKRKAKAKMGIMDRLKATVLTVISTAVLSGFYFFTNTVQDVKLPQSDHPTEFYSTQKGDDLRDIFVKAIQKAEKSIVLIIYTLTDPKIISAIKEKSDAGINVLVVYDSKVTYNPNRRKLGSGVKIVKRASSGLTHQKILVIDDKQVWVGSANMTTESMRLHGNLVLAMESPPVAKVLSSHAWCLAESDRESPGAYHRFLLDKQEMEFSILPNDKEAVNRVLKVIESAKKTMRVAMFTWTRKDFANAVIAAHNRGVDTEVAIDYYTGAGASVGVVKMLYDAGVPVYFNKGNGLLHYKMLYVDGKTLVNGSANWTAAAFKKNDDCFMILHDLTDQQRKYLDDLWKNIRRESVEYQEAA
jgi:phosphatidylserine/phosphatidylglycerophosphate/cardiolipin synthase-like enzyme